MPCTTAWHPTDTHLHRVKATREQVPIMLDMLGRLCTLLQEQSNVFAYTERIKLTLAVDPGLRCVEIYGLSNTEVPGQEAKKARLEAAGKAYGDLHSRVTAELCRLCRLSEKRPGHYLDVPTQKWWHNHKRSAGHCHVD